MQVQAVNQFNYSHTGNVNRNILPSSNTKAVKSDVFQKEQISFKGDNEKIVNGDLKYIDIDAEILLKGNGSIDTINAYDYKNWFFRLIGDPCSFTIADNLRIGRIVQRGKRPPNVHLKNNANIDTVESVTNMFIDNNCHVGKIIKQTDGIMLISDSSSVDMIESAESVSLGESCRIGMIKGGSISLNDNASVDTIDNADELSIYSDSANVKKVNAKETHISEGGSIQTLRTGELHINNFSNRNPIRLGDVFIDGTSSSTVKCYGDFDLSDKITFENGNGTLEIHNYSYGFKPMDKSKIQGGKIIYKLDEIKEPVDLDAYSVYLLNKFYSPDKKLVNNLTVEKSAELERGSEVNNITVTGTDNPYVVITGDLPKIKGKIEFKNAKGTVWLKEDSHDYTLPSINQAQVVNGVIKRLNSNADLEQINAKNSSSTSKTSDTNTLKGFSKVAGMDELKQTLRDDVIEPLLHPDEYKAYGLDVLNGFLLYGPPGCGKTFITKMLAEETGRYFVEISMSNIGTAWQNQTVVNLKNKFNEAVNHAPSIVFLDEVEAIAPVRAELAGHNNEVTERVGELLTQLNNCSNKNVFVICASNEPQKIDPAIKRSGRMDKRIYVGLPDETSRKELFKTNLQNRYTDKNIDYDLLAKKANDYIAADIKVIVDQGAMFALGEMKPISTNHLLNAIDITKPSLSKGEIEYYAAQAEE
jgi:ATP-dependent 26S proteasome regulatory subunit